jgi:1-phosphofructokinase
MIVTFTANPSVDRTAEIEVLVRGVVTRATAVRVDGAGKGVNVTRALAANGYGSIAVLPTGGSEGAQLLSLLDTEVLQIRAVPISGAVRSNITLAEPDGTTTKINEPGPTLSTTELGALSQALIETAQPGDWAVLSGSLPPGAPQSLYATLTDRLREARVNVAVDASGAVLDDALIAAPDLIKPNRRELEQAAGMEITSIDEALSAITIVRGRGARSVLASLGPDGAVLADATGQYHAWAPVAEPRSTVGAGDALLAGFLAAGGRGPAALKEAVAWGAAAVSLPGSRMPRPIDIDRAAVRITPLIVEETIHVPAHHG